MDSEHKFWALPRGACRQSLQDASLRSWKQRVGLGSRRCPDHLRESRGSRAVTPTAAGLCPGQLGLRSAAGSWPCSSKPQLPGAQGKPLGGGGEGLGRRGRGCERRVTLRLSSHCPLYRHRVTTVPTTAVNVHGHHSANRLQQPCPQPQAPGAGRWTPSQGRRVQPPTPPQLTLYTSPATSRYRLMAAFWYTKQKPCWPHTSCQSRQALSITQPKAMGPGMPPAERGHSEPSVPAAETWGAPALGRGMLATGALRGATGLKRPFSGASAPCRVIPQDPRPRGAFGKGQETAPGPSSRLSGNEWCPSPGGPASCRDA